MVIGNARTLSILVLILLAVNASVYRTVFAPRVLRVSVLNGGDPLGTVVVRSPSGKTVLIDTGRDASVLRALGTALPEWQRRLDAVVVTSLDARAAGGLPDVFGRYRVQILIRPEARGNKNIEQRIGVALDALHNLIPIAAHRGDRFALGGGAYLDVLWPPKTPAPLSAVDGSLVLKISYGATSLIISPALPTRAAAELFLLEEGSSAPSMVISSSTPPKMYLSDGSSVWGK